MSPIAIVILSLSMSADAFAAATENVDYATWENLIEHGRESQNRQRGVFGWLEDQGIASR